MAIDLGTMYRETFQRNFAHYGAARIAITYVSIGTPTYNKETQENVAGTNTSYPDIYVLEDRPKLEEIPGIIIEKDETGVTIPVLDLFPVPKLDDYYADSAGISWLITGVYPDNFKAMWLFKVKRIG